ncbi:PREDICTED: methylesterase 7-like [Camelina sativa]|uniref:Methylesterase 7-like n=1 Tax=Camelina sativa TaxID=90675 RepID=A0ABM0SWE9_CAMSA|nr:PREDICTED: methylesterase 7-like [Camelina sativa]
MDKKNQKRFVLVHGICHGAWCWHKVKPQLEAAGHCVTAVDLAASGLNMTRVEEIQTLKDYCKPLLELLSSLGPDDGKVILVAHSMGGISASLAADIFPSKVAAIVFVASLMPDTINPPGFFFEKLITSGPQENWMDTVITKPNGPLEFALFGPNFMAKNLYNLSSPQDLELAKMLVRVNPFATKELAGTKSLSEEGYGSVTRIYIVCGKDVAVTVDYQREMIENFPVKEVMEIKDADHMPMFSKPQELCALLLEIADKHA